MGSTSVGADLRGASITHANARAIRAARLNVSVVHGCIGQPCEITDDYVSRNCRIGPATDHDAAAVSHVGSVVIDQIIFNRRGRTTEDCDGTTFVADNVECLQLDGRRVDRAIAGDDVIGNGKGYPLTNDRPSRAIVLSSRYLETIETRSVGADHDRAVSSGIEY